MSISKKLLLVFLSILLINTVQAQSLRSAPSKEKKEDKGFSWDRVVVGGNFGLWFGRTTFIDISPSVGYFFTDQFMAGIGGTYIYIAQKYDIIDLNTGAIVGQQTFKTYIAGGRLFSRYYLTENIFAHVQYEALSLECFGNNRVWVGSPLIGGGYAQEMGRSSRWYIMLLYNLNEHICSPYINPLIKIGFAVGL